MKIGQNWWKLELDEKGKFVYMRFFLLISCTSKYEHRHAKNWTSLHWKKSGKTEENWKKLMKIEKMEKMENLEFEKMWFFKDVAPSVDFVYFQFRGTRAKKWTSWNSRKLVNIVKNWWKLVKTGDYYSKRISPLSTVWNWLSCLTLLARDRLVSAGSDFLHVAQRARFLLNQ